MIYNAFPKLDNDIGTIMPIENLMESLTLIHKKSAVDIAHTFSYMIDLYYTMLETKLFLGTPLLTAEY